MISTAYEIVLSTTVTTLTLTNSIFTFTRNTTANIPMQPLAKQLFGSRLKEQMNLVFPLVQYKNYNTQTSLPATRVVIRSIASSADVQEGSIPPDKEYAIDPSITVPRYVQCGCTSDEV
jgi:hypothetical protein